MDMTLRVDRFPAVGETVAATETARMPGGKGFNQALALAKLGASVTFVGAVGDDGARSDFESPIADVGGVCMLQVVPGTPTGIGVPIVDAAGRKIIVANPGASMALSPAIPVRLLAEARWDAVLVHLDVPAETLTVLLGQANSAGALSVVSPAPWQPFAPAIATLARVIVANRHEALRLVNASGDRGFGSETPRSLLARMNAEYRSEMAVMTLAGEGAAALEGPDFRFADSYPVPLTDTTGAGDAFVAAFLFGILTGKSLDQALRLGNAGGALACTVEGASASMPHRNAVFELAGL